jgi:hypothetical protein
MSGNTGTHYGKTFNDSDYYTKNPKYAPQALMDRFKNDSLSNVSLKQQVKM